MAATTETPPERIAGLSLKEEDDLQGEPAAASATSEHGVDPDYFNSTANAKKKTKKKKKKKKKGGAGDREKSKGVMPTQPLVDQSFPWTAANRPNVGRCAISARAIKAGEVVVAEQAIAFIPRCQNRLLVCHSCCTDLSETPPSSFECPRCKYAVFCKDCKEEAVEQHKSWCHVSSTITENARVADCDEDLLRFVLALALQRNPNKPTSAGTTVNGGLKEGTVRDGIIYPSYEDAICLKTHSEKATASWRRSVKKGCQFLYDEAVKEMGLNKVTFSLGELENLAALVNTNSHGMGAHGSGIHNTDVAVGTFPFVSMLNHSCRPNCCFASEGRVMYVRATQEIPKNTELCVSYINLYEPRSTRKMQLAATKHFHCCCPRCSEPFASSVDLFLEGCMCSARGCGGVMVKASSFLEKEDSTTASGSWKCGQCSRILDPNVLGYPTKQGYLADHPWLLVARAEQKLAEAMSVYRERRFKDARALLEQYGAEFTGKLHPLNVLLFDALTPLMNCCRAVGDAAEGSRVCRSIVECMEKVVPGISLELANFYFCLGEMYSERSEASSSNGLIKRYRKRAEDALQHVLRIREICLGKATLPG